MAPLWEFSLSLSLAGECCFTGVAAASAVTLALPRPRWSNPWLRRGKAEDARGSSQRVYRGLLLRARPARAWLRVRKRYLSLRHLHGAWNRGIGGGAPYCSCSAYRCGRSQLLFFLSLGYDMTRPLPDAGHTACAGTPRPRDGAERVLPLYRVWIGKPPFGVRSASRVCRGRLLFFSACAPCPVFRRHGEKVPRMNEKKHLTLYPRTGFMLKEGKERRRRSWV